ncbi:MAG: hypothetical protein DRP06_00565 [Candidatus Aenigmatarchaeota archaeon]|nr:MAG: hypothetical protein DRP06_00565 [Candidatus Aenigmarchaeota archaeon]
MSRPTKYERKVKEAVYIFIVVPLIFVIGIFIVSDFISRQMGGEIFKWFLFSAGTLSALVFYFKEKLKDSKW